MRNLLTKVPKSAQGLVATLVRTIFAQPDAELTRAQHARVVEQLEPRWPEAARLLAEAIEDLLAFTACPKEHWRQIWSNNPQQRLNRELSRRGRASPRRPSASRGGAPIASESAPTSSVVAVGA